MTEIVQKAEFARRAGVGKSAVSNWIAAEQLTREPGGGLVQQGKREMIDVEAATRRLDIVLDQGQSLGNGALRRRNLAASESSPVIPRVEVDEYKAVKTRIARLDESSTRLKVERERGRWVSREDAASETRRAIGTVIAQLTHAVEQDMPLALAAELGIAPATLRAAMRKAWRTARTRIADGAMEKADVLDVTSQRETSKEMAP